MNLSEIRSKIEAKEQLSQLEYRERARARIKISPKQEQLISQIDSLSELVELIHFWWLANRDIMANDIQIERALWEMNDTFAKDRMIL